MKVVVRTHGGLGNQLFQLLYARLFSRMHGALLFDAHDSRYTHAFARSRELVGEPPGGVARALSSLRLPKLATRAGYPTGRVRIFGTTYLDGYFQAPADYANFNGNEVRDELQRLRLELNIPPAPSRGIGVHLRLGDFFSTETAVSAHLSERLTHIPTGAWIVTNDEERLAHPDAVALLSARGARVLTTRRMSAEQVLRTLADFTFVDGNDSTLLFWASVLSGMECVFRTPDLAALREHFLALQREPDRV